MQIHSNVNFAAASEQSAAINIERRLLGLRLAEAAEVQDLGLLQAAIAACAVRESARRTAKTGEASAEAVAMKAKADELAEREAVIVRKAQLEAEEFGLSR